MNYDVHIYGSGSKKTSLVDFINQYHLNDLIKIYEPTQELNNKLAQSKIVVVPSRNEGFGMIILEAMVQDNIVISFEGNVGPDSIINNGDNGYLVNYENVSELAKRIDLTTQHYNELDHIIENSKDTLKQFSPDHIYQLFMSINKIGVRLSSFKTNCLTPIFQMRIYITITLFLKDYLKSRHPKARY